MWTKPEYMISPTQWYFQGAFSMSWEKLEWEEEAGGRENRAKHTRRIFFFFLHSCLKELHLRTGWEGSSALWQRCHPVNTTDKIFSPLLPYCIELLMSPGKSAAKSWRFGETLACLFRRGSGGQEVGCAETGGPRSSLLPHCPRGAAVGSFLTWIAALAPLSLFLNLPCHELASQQVVPAGQRAKWGISGEITPTFIGLVTDFIHFLLKLQAEQQAVS